MRSPEIDGWIKTINPGDRSDSLGRHAFTLAHVDDAVDAARRGAESLRNAEIAARAEAIRTLANRLEEEANDLAVLITREVGKPLWESAGEVQSTVKSLRRLAAQGVPFFAPTVVKEGVSWHEPASHGVVALISPWTQPLLQPALAAAAALLAGNGVVFKPSKFAAGVGQALTEAMDRLRLPRGGFNLIQGPGAQLGRRLCGHPGVDAVVFAGRTETARAVREQNLDRPALPMHLQVGGKAAAVVLEDAQVDLAAWEIALGAFVSAGQRHDATARAIVVRAQAEAFTERLARIAGQVRVGYGFDDEVFMGPLVSDAHRRAFREQRTTGALAEMTSVYEGGDTEVEGRSGFYVRPDIRLRDGPGDGAFLPAGPSLQVWVVEDEDAAVEAASGLSYRGVVSVFGGDSRVDTLCRSLPYGVVHIDRATVGGSSRLSSVPRGQASNGWPGGADLLRFFAPGRAVVVDGRPMDEARQVPGMGPLPSSG